MPGFCSKIASTFTLLSIFIMVIIILFFYHLVCLDFKLLSYGASSIKLTTASMSCKIKVMVVMVDDLACSMDELNIEFVGLIG